MEYSSTSEHEQVLRAIKALLVGRQRLIEANFKEARDKAWRRYKQERLTRDRLARKLQRVVTGSYAERRLRQLVEDINATSGCIASGTEGGEGD